jgi:hypothetical protein
MQSEKLIKKLNQIRAELDQLEEVIRKDLAVEETISQIPPPPVERAQEIIESEKKEKTEEQAPPSPNDPSSASETGEEISEDQRALLAIFIIAALFCNFLLSAQAANTTPTDFIDVIPWVYERYPNVLSGWLIQGSVVWVIPAIACLVSFFRKKNYVHTYLVWQGWLLALTIIGLVGQSFK